MSVPVNPAPDDGEATVRGDEDGPPYGNASMDAAYAAGRKNAFREAEEMCRYAGGAGLEGHDIADAIAERAKEGT